MKRSGEEATSPGHYRLTGVDPASRDIYQTVYQRAQQQIPGLCRAPVFTRPPRVSRLNCISRSADAWRGARRLSRRSSIAWHRIREPSEPVNESGRYQAMSVVEPRSPVEQMK